MRRMILLSLAALICVTGCGGSQPANRAARPAGGEQEQAGGGKPTLEDRWLRGLWASDIRKALPADNIRCAEPRQEGQTTAWRCEWGTPLVTYDVRFYGAAPGKIEYVNATVRQSDQPKDSLTQPLFVSLAGLRFDGADPATARAWVQKTLADGGQTVFGPAKFKLSGDVTKRTLEIKAAGSDW